MKRNFPALEIVGAYSPPFKKEFSEADNLEMIKMINSADPDILWVGMTAPKQEKWIYENLGRLNVRVAIGIGAVFDYVSAKVKRAPEGMQKCGLEWFWRLLQEPRRLWKRYLVGNTLFILLVLREIVRRAVHSLWFRVGS